jgi:hypothetical protein
MHYYTIIVTNQFPTDEVLDRALAPWKQIGDGWSKQPSSGKTKFDYFQRSVSEPRSNIDPARVSIPFALVVNGTWHETDFFAKDSKWEPKVRELVAAVAPDHWLSLVNCHR